jgi:predicted PurR-regulated permease PerM
MDASRRDILPRGVLLLVGTAAATVAFVGIKGTSHLVGPIFLALVLTVLVHPLRGRMTRARVPGWAAALACIVIVYAIFVGLTLALVVAGARFAELLPSYQDELGETVTDVTEWLASLGVPVERLEGALGSLDLSRLTDIVTGLIGGLLGLLSNLVFIGTVVLFLTFDAGSFPRHLARLGTVRPMLAGALGNWAVGTRTYLLVSTVFGLIVAVIDTAALALLGIPVPVLWGLLAFITNYIPNIGFVIGLVPPAVLGLLEGGPVLMLQVVAVYSVINVVIQSVIQPKFVGDAVGLSTTLTFVSLVFWAWVLGPLGALLAIPLSLFVKAVLVDADPSAAWLQPILSNRDDAQSGIVTTSTTVTPTELK